MAIGIFSYKAVNVDGQTVNGKLVAAGREEALQTLLGKGLHPFSVGEESIKFNQMKAFGLLERRQKEGNLIFFTQQLANLLLAGVRLGEALEIISILLKPGAFKKVVMEVNNSLRSGSHFSASLAEHPGYFSSTYIGMIKAGEEGGFLGLTCQRLARTLESSARFKAFLFSSLIYPFILLVVAIFAVVVMLTYVLPKFMQIYSNYGKTLPWSTRFLLQLNRFLSDHWWLLIGVLAVLIICLVVYRRTAYGRRQLDEFRLKLPVVGKLSIALAMTEICRSIGTMLENGVSLIKALNVSCHISNNQVFQTALVEAGVEVERGKHLSEALAKTGVFPATVVALTGIGEHTGKMGTMLQQAADHYEQEGKESLEKVVKTFEPVLILTMGLIIGFIVISMLLPVLGISVI